MTHKKKLELTWIDKEEQSRLEPRIIIEDYSKSCHATSKSEGDIFDNLLIHGDNLLALKALESEYSGSVKCIYIDPPFNTKQAFENYEDGVEHSIWLTMMRRRLLLLHRLLRGDGTLFIHIDDNELGYLIVLTDEIFGRANRIGIISFKQRSISGPKSINPGLVTTTNYIIYYAKNKSNWKPNRVYAARKRDVRYGTYIDGRERDCSEWRFMTLRAAFERHMLSSGRTIDGLGGDRLEAAIEEFVVQHADSVTQLASINPIDVSADARAILLQSVREPNRVFKVVREKRSDIFFIGGKQIIFYSSKLRNIDGAVTTAEPISNAWDDLLSNNVHKEGGVKFPNGKKPEALIKRILELETEPGDLVLDSFCGSGTTAAVAHKMRRRWIAIELGEHAETHALPRLQRVVRGEDRDGISRVTGWQGGGGFRFCRLAPSLLERDKWGNWVVSKDYNPTMLAEAMCKHMGFIYGPSQDAAEYWNHGFSSERDFIYVTTQALTHGMLTAISNDVGPDRRLLVCCKAYSGNVGAFENLTVRKIPQAILTTCEWGRDDYSLRIAALPVAEPASAAADAEGSDAGESVTSSGKRGRKRKAVPSSGVLGLFDAVSETEV